MLAIRNATRDEWLADRVVVADSVWTRLRGMIGRPQPGKWQGLLLRPCQSVHMHWMTYPLDVAFLAPDGRVVATYNELAPWSRSKWHADADRALELQAGRLAATRTEVGDHLELVNQGEGFDHG